jgi:hypothetical protein
LTLSFYFKVNSDLVSDDKKIDSEVQTKELNIDLDSEIYREDSESDEEENSTKFEIQNEHSPVNEEIIESSHSEYLSYKSSNYYEIKNNLRKNKYFDIKTQCPLASIPGVLDVFVDSESSRLIVKLHLSDSNGNHTFRLFRSNGSLRRHLWKFLNIQINESRLLIFMDSVLDTQIDLSQYGILFAEFSKNKTYSEEFIFFKKLNSSKYRHQGLLLGNLDRLEKKENFDELKYDRVYNTYQSKSLLDLTNQEFFKEISKVTLFNSNITVFSLQTVQSPFLFNI